MGTGWVLISRCHTTPHADPHYREGDELIAFEGRPCAAVNGESNDNNFAECCALCSCQWGVYDNSFAADVASARACTQQPSCVADALQNGIYELAL
eukprot:8850940-Karenia_brevis.AAC.1